MANFSQRRLFLSLRKIVLSILSSNSSISRSSSLPPHLRNPSFRSSPFSSFSQPKLFASFDLSPLIQYRGFCRTSNGVRSFGTLFSECSLSPKPKDTVMLEGCDMEHWLVVVDTPDQQLTRDEIIDGYVETLAKVIGSKEEARMKLYSVSTRHYFAFGALIPEELTDKLREQPNVQWVLPDSYMDVKNKMYAGEPVINGQPVPYDPKYHEVWVHNHRLSLTSSYNDRRKQRDRQPRPVASGSAHGSLNKNWTVSPVSRYHAPESETSNLQISVSSSLSDPGIQRQNGMVPADSQIQNPSVALNQVMDQTPQSSLVPNNSMLSNNPLSSSPLPASVYSSSQGWSSQNNSSEHPIDNQILAQHPSDTQNPTSPLAHIPNSYDPARNVQNQNWETPPRYQSQPQQPPMLNNLSPYNITTPAPSHMQNQTPPPSHTPNSYDPAKNGQKQNWETAPRYQNQPQQPQIPNQFPYDVTPSAPSQTQNQTYPPSHRPNPYDSARNVQNQNEKTPPRYQSQPQQPPMLNNLSPYNITTPAPSHMQNQTPVSSPTPNQYDIAMSVQNQDWNFASRYQSHPQQPPMPNNQFSYDGTPSAPSHMQNQTPSASHTSNPYDPARNVQSQNRETSLRYQSQSQKPQISNNQFPYDTTTSGPFSYDAAPSGPSHIQKQTPPSCPPNPYDPARNVESQDWDTFLGYQSQPQQTSMPNNQFPYDTITPSAPFHLQNQTPLSSLTPNPYDPAMNVQNQDWEIATRYQSQPQQLPMANNQFSNDGTPSAPSHMQNQTATPLRTLNPYDPARNIQSQDWETSLRHQTQPQRSPMVNNQFPYNSTPSSACHMQNQTPLSSHTPNSYDPRMNVPEQNWEIASTYQSQHQQSPLPSNQFSYNATPSALSHTHKQTPPPSHTPNPHEEARNFQSINWLNSPRNHS
ncbi:uncharacterized protein LOC130826848 isoform X1 [Amaranthus tricolor]|uniref:uncharacterized protein LOC130826848 isoform X1 n=2 Tax=Amaranthus tricolor TaxID=29722 RepID=UPI0025856A53|nr:uncharacterized protein LOC130826848 isoform X1 [Amaranthus tricolor]